MYHMQNLTGPQLNIYKDAIDDATDEAFYVRPPGGSQSRPQEIKVRDGISEAEQIRRGIRLWIESRRGVGEKTGRKRAVTRRRS